MFFEGSLQDGISLAVQQSKLVVCFVTDGESESQQWENEFLADDSLKSSLESEAVSLRLPAGSQEAGFLEALFPVPKKPTVVIIQNGQLKEYIASGTSKEEFVRRVAAIFNTTANQSQSSAAAPTAQTPQQQASHVPAPTAEDNEDDLYDDDVAPAQPAAPANPVRERNIPVMIDEVERMAAEKRKEAKEAKAKADREAAEVEARRRADERSDFAPSDPERTYAEKVKQRKQQANEERKRILKRIEDDKRARKERETEERKARQLLSQNPDGEGPSSPTAPIPLSSKMPASGKGDHCNLQVRLFDGSTIRSRFPSENTLSRDVRKWIDEERTDGDAPYSFRVVLTPLPNKAIEPTEEIESLLSLGLAPSATLVLVPVKYTSAYAHTGGFLWSGLRPIFGIFSSGYGAITGLFGGIFGMIFGRRNAQTGQDGVPMENLGTGRNSRIRGFQNPDDRARDAQLYNGNSLNFEPRRDEDGEEEG